MSEQEQEPQEQSAEENSLTEESDSGYEQSDINVGKIVGLGVGIVIFLIVSFTLLNSFFIKSKDDLVYEQVLKPGNPKLAALRKQNDEILHSYGIVDSTKGVYRIPIDRAMQLVAEESFQQRIEKAEGH